MSFLASEPVLNYCIIPLLICLARSADVTLGTIRIIFISRGHRVLAPLLGFFEVLIWLLAMTQIMQNLTNIMNYLAFAFGFALGNYLGLIINERLAIGHVMVRIITSEATDDIIRRLNDANFGITAMGARGASGQVQALFMVAKKKDLQQLINLVNRLIPRAFITVEDVLRVQEGIFPFHNASRFSSLVKLFPLKKAK